MLEPPSGPHVRWSMPHRSCRTSCTEVVAPRFVSRRLGSTGRGAPGRIQDSPPALSSPGSLMLRAYRAATMWKRYLKCRGYHQRRRHPDPAWRQPTGTSYRVRIIQRERRGICANLDRRIAGRRGHDDRSDLDTATAHRIHSRVGSYPQDRSRRVSWAPPESSRRHARWDIEGRNSAPSLPFDGVEWFCLLLPYPRTPERSAFRIAGRNQRRGHRCPATASWRTYHSSSRRRSP